MPPTMTTQTIEDTLIASVRFWGQLGEIPQRFGELLEHAHPRYG